MDEKKAVPKEFIDGWQVGAPNGCIEGLEEGWLDGLLDVGIAVG